jgi:hypothetical protein
MPPGQLEQRWTGPAIVGGHAAADGVWGHDACGEPPLSELLDDPIMALLWRADDLEPATARATVRALQAKVRKLRQAEPPARARQRGTSASARHDRAA